MAIQLTIAIDTASLPTGGSDPTQPATFGHDQAFMITDSAHCAGGNGTATLQLQGPIVNGVQHSIVGETLQVWGTSLSNQFQDEVFIYDFQHWQNDNSPKNDTVLDTQGLNPQTFYQDAQVPTPGPTSHNPPMFTSELRAFPCTEIDITGHGTEFFKVRFMVYGPKDANGRPMKGYYEWDPSITTV
jgi:hypothetical protein